MPVAGRGYRDGVRNLGVMLEYQWREEAGDTGRRNSYGGQNFFICVLGVRGERRTG